MRAGPAVAVAVVVLLAGCGLPAASDGETTTTVTPAPVPTEPTPLNLGPDVAVGDSLASVQLAHERALNGTTFGYRALFRGPTPNRPDDAVDISLRGVVAANRTAVLLAATFEEGSYRQFSNGSVFVSLQREGDSRRGAVGEPALAGDAQAVRLASSFLFPLDRTTVTSVTRVDDRYRIVAQVDAGARESIFDGSRVPNAMVRLSVRPNGTIDSYRLTYTVVHDGTARDGVEEYSFEPGVTLTRPPWVDRVLANHSG